MRAPVIVVRCGLVFLVCAQGLCQAPKLGSTPADPHGALAGTFESVARGDSFFGGGTSNAAPLFTVSLGTNGTYFVFCASADIEPHMDGGGSFIRAGREFGTWRWGGDRYHPEVVFTATNRSHMNLLFPSHMKVDWRDLNRLTAINPSASEKSELPRGWIPLSSPYFYRKSQ